MKAIFYDWGGANVWIFHLINNVHASWLDHTMLLATALANHNNFPQYLAAVACAAWITSCRQTDTKIRQMWLSVLTVFSVAYVVDGAFIVWLKPFLDFPRPPLALAPGTFTLVGQAEYHHSLPSGHSSFAMVFVASLWPVIKSWQKWIGVAFVAWVGISRVSLGAHFPADVLAGYISSLLIVLLVSWSMSRVICPLLNDHSKPERKPTP